MFSLSWLYWPGPGYLLFRDPSYYLLGFIFGHRQFVTLDSEYIPDAVMVDEILSMFDENGTCAGPRSILVAGLELFHFGSHGVTSGSRPAGLVSSGLRGLRFPEYAPILDAFSSERHLASHHSLHFRVGRIFEFVVHGRGIAIAITKCDFVASPDAGSLFALPIVFSFVEAIASEISTCLTVFLTQTEIGHSCRKHRWTWTPNR